MLMSKINSPNLRLTILGLSLILVMSCSKTNKSNNQNTADNVLHINLPDKISDELCKASSIADTIIYVPLETNSKSIFGYPWLMAMNDSCIVLSDKKRIMAFQRNGKFIGQVGKEGKGPGEFIHINGLLLKDDTLYIASLGKKELSKYTIDCKTGCIYHGGIAVKQDSYYMRHLCELPNGGYAWYDKTNGNVVYFNEKWKIIDTLSVENNVSKKREFRSQSSTDDQYLIKNNNQLLFKDYKNDTIWDISSKEKKPAIIINTKEKLLPDHLQVEYTHELFMEKAKNYYRLNFMQTDSSVFIIQRNWAGFSKLSFFVYNMVNKETKQYRKPVIYDDISGNTELPLFFYFDNTVFSFVDYFDIKDEYEKATSPKVKEFWAKQLKGAKEDDNSTMVIIKTK